MLRSIRTLICIYLLTSATMSHAAPGFISITIESAGGDGRAYKTVMADGSMTGGHISGMPPRIYRSEGSLPPEQLAELQSMLLQLTQDSTAVSPPAPETAPSSYRSISIIWDAERTQRGVSVGSNKFALPLLEQIYGLISHQRTGGW